jgi:hypothetical protein
MEMRRIGEILAASGAASEEQRNRAILRQVRNRGRFGTALLEEGVLEEEIAKALSQQHHVPAAPPRELEDVRPDTARLIPVKLAQRLEVVPFRRAGRTLALAMRNPQDLPAVDEVASLTGLTVEPYVATEARIYMALAKYYGQKLEHRYAALARRISLRSGERERFPPDVSAPPPLPASHRSGSTLRVVSPPPSSSGPVYPARASLVFERVDPWAAGEAAAASLRTAPPPHTDIFEESLASQGAAVSRELDHPSGAGSETVAIPPVPVPVPVLAPLAAAVPVPAPDAAAPAATRPLERPAPEPLSLSDRLGNAETRDEIAEGILEEASLHVRRAALFVSQPDRMLGWAAWPEPPDGLRSFELMYREPSVFATLRNTEGFYVGPFPDLTGTVKTLRALGSDGLGTMAVVPVNLKGKTVLFLYGESESYTRPPSVPVLKRLAAMAATALEIILMKNRLRNL